MFSYYENGYLEKFTISDVQALYNNVVDHDEYNDFDSWLYDMEKMQILIRF